MKTICVIGVLLLGFVAYAKLYNRRPACPTAIKSVATAYAALLVVMLAITRVHVERPLSPELAASLLLMPFIMLAFRFLLEKGLASKGLWQSPTLVVGDSAGLGWIRRSLSAGGRQGLAWAGDLDFEQLPSVRYADWQSLVSGFGARQLLVVLTDRPEADRALLESVMRGRVPFTVVRTGAELPVAGAHSAADIVRGAAVTTYRSQITEPASRVAKAVFDVVAASVLILMASPVMVIIALLVRADGASALFAHERVGRDGRRFRCLKFRSMVPDPHRVLQQTLQSDPEARREWAERQKLTNDPRVTAIGRLLRATSLDELPQLFNIVRLDMSLVGPRPIVENEIPRYGDDIDYYYKTRPGLTGLWQVSGRSDTTYEQRVELDRAYVKNWSLQEDIMIILRTLPAVLSQRGAR